MRKSLVYFCTFMMAFMFVSCQTLPKAPEASKPGKPSAPGALNLNGKWNGTAEWKTESESGTSHEQYEIVQEGMVIAAVEMENGKAYVTRKIAEKDLYTRKIKANADLQVKLAEAERVRLRNSALKGVGSERMVALKMADAYKGLDLIILPSDGQHGVNPLNLNNTLKLFDVRKGGGK